MSSSLHAPSPVAIPPAHAARVVGAYASTAVETARELGADMTRLALACGLPLQGQALPESIPVQRYISMLDAAAAQLDDPFFGLHVGQRMRLSTFASYGLVLCTCRDFRAAAEQTRRFEGLAHDLGRSELVEQDGLAHYRWHSPWLEAPGGRHLSESVMGGIHTFASWLAGARMPAIELRFTHTAPQAADLDEYQRVLHTPVRFAAAVTEAIFPAALLDAPVPNADPSLFQALSQVAQERLAARQRETSQAGIVPAVREHIQALLMHDAARLPDVAAAMGLTARTLQRRLAEADMSFSTLLDEVRRERVQHYLRDPALSLTDIAFLLGFAQQSNFNHAFRAWFGTTPAVWRTSSRS